MRLQHLLLAASLGPPRSPPCVAAAGDGRLTAKISRATDMRQLLRLQESRGADFNSLHVGAFWNQLGRLSRGSAAQRAWLDAHSDQLAPATSLTASMLDEMSGRTLASVARGLAAVPPPPGAGEVWPRLAERARAELPTMKPMELCSLTHAVALSGSDAPALFDAAAVETLPRLSEFAPKELSGLAWAFARADCLGVARRDNPLVAPPPPPSDGAARLRASAAVREAAALQVRRAVICSLLEELAEHARLRAAQMSAREVSTLCWAYGRLNVSAPALLDELCARALLGLECFTPQGLANTAWGLARAAHDAPETFDALAHEAVGRLRSFSAQELATLAWAFATAGRASPPFLHALAAELQPRAAELAPQGVANVAWAFATTGVPAPSLFDALSRAALPALPAFKSQELANLAWAMASAGHVAPALFDGLVVQAQLRLGGGAAGEGPSPEQKLNAQDISTIAWAFATSRKAAPQAFADHFGWRLLQTPYWEWDALSLADPAAELRARSNALSGALVDALELSPRRAPRFARGRGRGRGGRARRKPGHHTRGGARVR